MAKRIQRKRTKGWKMPENTIYVGRPSRWGNPFKIEPLYDFWYGVRIPDAEDKLILQILLKYTRPAYSFQKEAVAASILCYQKYLEERTLSLEELKGKNLACWCPVDKPCHADVLLKMANI